MTHLTSHTEPYVANFERLDKLTASAAPPWLRQLRAAAMDCFAKLGFPDPHHEEWRFTPLTALAKVGFGLGFGLIVLGSHKIAPP